MKIKHHAWALFLGLVLGAFAASGAQDLAPGAFTRYTNYSPAVPVLVMPGERMIHRFFDTSPISPSGRFLAAFRLPYENRSPAPGDAGDVLLIDPRSGATKVVATSRGWEAQLGANVQWGRTDAEIYFNDVDTNQWTAFAVQINPLTGARRELDGPVFMVSPDGSALISHNLVKSRRAQVGYGVVVPSAHIRKNIGPVNDDGIYITDTRTGRCRMLVSLKEIYERSVPSIASTNPASLEYYCFQAKWNPQGTRLLTTVQWAPLRGGPRQRTVITMNKDGSDIRTAITARLWARGGHHVNWCPDGDHLSMNLNIDDDPALELVRVKYDGTGLQTIFKPGSGHPSFHADGRFIVTDAYPDEPVAFGDGSVPIRLIDTEQRTCVNIVRIFVSSAAGEFRVDPHPAWYGGRYVVFNGFVGNTRKVYVADLHDVLRSPVKTNQLPVYDMKGTP